MTKFTMWKKLQNWSNKYIQTACTSSYHAENTWKVSKRSEQKCKRISFTRRTHCLSTEGEKWLSSQCRKGNEIDPTIIPKPHAHSHIMKKTHVMFQNDRYKIVEGVALTRDAHYLYIEGKNDYVHNVEKGDKKSNNYIHTACTFSYHEENTRKVSKRSVQNCQRSCPHKTPRVNVDGWTNGGTVRQTDGRTDENLHA